mmetsp:Transcript_46519/g.108135  ORF Transcript_46519/g.108135 Transcript_46519/m.108135 type:complete len:357 (+) Transcript_46519:756-1826(+)
MSCLLSSPHICWRASSCASSPTAISKRTSVVAALLLTSSRSLSRSSSREASIACEPCLSSRSTRRRCASSRALAASMSPRACFASRSAFSMAGLSTELGALFSPPALLSPSSCGMPISWIEEKLLIACSSTAKKTLCALRKNSSRVTLPSPSTSSCEKTTSTSWFEMFPSACALHSISCASLQETNDLIASPRKGLPVPCARTSLRMRGSCASRLFAIPPAWSHRMFCSSLLLRWPSWFLSYFSQSAVSCCSVGPPKPETTCESSISHIFVLALRSALCPSRVESWTASCAAIARNADSTAARLSRTSERRRSTSLLKVCMRHSVVAMPIEVSSLLGAGAATLVEDKHLHRCMYTP